MSKPTISRSIPLTLLLTFVVLEPARGQEPVWGPWEYAETMTQSDPLGGVGVGGQFVFGPDDVCARFVVNTVGKIEAGAFLGTTPDFVPSAVALRFRLRDLSRRSPAHARALAHTIATTLTRGCPRRRPCRRARY